MSAAKDSACAKAHHGIAHRGIWIAVLVIAICEVFLFNLGFWASLPQRFKADSTIESLRFSVGPGLAPSPLNDANADARKAAGAGDVIYVVRNENNAYLQVDTQALDPGALNRLMNTIHINQASYQPDLNTNKDYAYAQWMGVHVEVLPQDASAATAQQDQIENEIAGQNELVKTDNENRGNGDSTIVKKSVEKAEQRAMLTDRINTGDSSFTLALPAENRLLRQAQILKDDEQNGWIVGPRQTYSPFAPGGAELSIPRVSGKIRAIRIRFVQPTGMTSSFAGAQIDKPINFTISPIRLLFMALIAVFVLAFAPSSRLWAIKLNPASHKQRWLVALNALPFLLVVIGAIIYQPFVDLHSLPIGQLGSYFYEYDQYDRVADALLHGRTWLNLPVPAALAAAKDPYSLAVRNQLLQDGVTPIYWDHAFFHGHWYCYFGALPAVVLFLPFQLITSIWTPGGVGLSTGTAGALCVLAFAIGSALLIVRMLQRHFPGCSLATAILCVIGFQTAAQIIVMLFRFSFYELPYDSALALAAFGLWLWIGARRKVIGQTRTKSGKVKRVTRMWTIADGTPSEGIADGTIVLSRARLIGGSALLAAEIGCRPPFIAAVLLAFPIFWYEIVGGTFFSWLRPSFWKAHRAGKSLRNDADVLLTMLIVIAPFLLYNYLRFGKFTDFGNNYQLTVNDMATYKAPASVIGPLVYYYLFQPPTFANGYPLLMTNATPLPAWQFREAWIAGLFWTVPFVFLGVLGLLLHRELHRRRLLGVCSISLVLGVLLSALDSDLGGLSMRYVEDFGWLFGIAAVAGAGVMIVAANKFDAKFSRLAASAAVADGTTGGAAAVAAADRATATSIAASTSASASNIPAPQAALDDTAAAGTELVTEALGDSAGPAMKAMRVALPLIVGIGLLMGALEFVQPGRLAALNQSVPQISFLIKNDFTNWLLVFNA